MNHVCVIAEAGVNHNGNIALAKKMIAVAKDAGADYVKFQTFVPENMTSKYAEKAEYQKRTTDVAESQVEMLRKLALSKEEYWELKKYSDELQIGFLSTPFDIESIAFLQSFDMDFWKIPSGEITNYPYLVEIAKTHKDIVLSTGMSTIQEIKCAIELLQKNEAGKITLLHCNTQYPTAYEDVNLRAMNFILKETGLGVGYSDHTLGIEIPVAAVALGACVIEKHFTLDRSMEGPDHKASLEPQELKEMIASIRHVENALGLEQKTVTLSEQGNIHVARKSIVARRMIKKDEVLTNENITTKRPGIGINPMRWNEVLGTRAIRDFEEDELIEI